MKAQASFMKIQRNQNHVYILPVSISAKTYFASLVGGSDDYATEVLM